MRDSNSNNGYTVLYGLGCSEASIAAGELAEVMVACAGPSMRQSVTTTMYMTSQIVKLGRLYVVAEGLGGFLPLAVRVGLAGVLLF